MIRVPLGDIILSSLYHATSKTNGRLQIRERCPSLAAFDRILNERGIVFIARRSKAFRDRMSNVSAFVNGTHRAHRFRTKFLLLFLSVSLGREAYVEEFLKDPFLLDAALKAWRLAFGFDSAQTRTLYQTYFHPTQLDWPQESAKTSFPKMPVALLYMTHEDTYKAISRWIQFTSQTAISFSPSLNGAKPFCSTLKCTFSLQRACSWLHECSKRRNRV